MSINRNDTKPTIASAIVYWPSGAINKGIQVPTNSSMLTARGSLPQYLSITLLVQIPTIVVTTTKEMVVRNNANEDKCQYNMSQTTNARNAPAVPGAIGTKPVPKPVERMTWNKGAFPIL